MRARLARLLTCESGATAIEYALLALVMAVAIVAAANLVGSALSVSLARLTSNVT